MQGWNIETGAEVGAQRRGGNARNCMSHPTVLASQPTLPGGAQAEYPGKDRTTTEAPSEDSSELAARLAEGNVALGAACEDRRYPTQCCAPCFNKASLVTVLNHITGTVASEGYVESNELTTTWPGP